MTVSGVRQSNSTSQVGEVNATEPTSNREAVEAKLRPSYEESQKEIKEMDDILAKGEAADPGNKDIKRAREDLKDLDKAMDDVFKYQLQLGSKMDQGNPEDIEKARDKVFDSQQNFAEKYDDFSKSIEKITGNPMPPLEQ